MSEAPSVDWQKIITQLEGDLAAQLTRLAVAGLVRKWPWLGGAIANPIVGLAIGFVVGLGVKYGDWLSFMVVDDWKRTREGEAYVKAALDNAHTPTPENKQAQIDAFDRLLGVK